MKGCCGVYRSACFLLPRVPCAFNVPLVLDVGYRSPGGPFFATLYLVPPLVPTSGFGLYELFSDVFGRRVAG